MATPIEKETPMTEPTEPTEDLTEQAQPEPTPTAEAVPMYEAPGFVAGSTVLIDSETGEVKGFIDDYPEATALPDTGDLPPDAIKLARKMLAREASLMVEREAIMENPAVQRAKAVIANAERMQAKYDQALGYLARVYRPLTQRATIQMAKASGAKHWLDFNFESKYRTFEATAGLNLKAPEAPDNVEAVLFDVLEKIKPGIAKAEFKCAYKFDMGKLSRTELAEVRAAFQVACPERLALSEVANILPWQDETTKLYVKPASEASLTKATKSKKGKAAEEAQE